MRRRGRPGLIGTMARTAVVAGTANAVTRRSQMRAVEQQQAAAYREDQAAASAAPPPVSPAPAGGLASELSELAKLRDSGILTAEEFDAAKARLLA